MMGVLGEGGNVVVMLRTEDPHRGFDSFRGVARERGASGSYAVHLSVQKGDEGGDVVRRTDDLPVIHIPRIVEPEARDGLLGSITPSFGGEANGEGGLDGGRQPRPSELF